jgi:outer membrane lipoprotein-sorting protein
MTLSIKAMVLVLAAGCLAGCATASRSWAPSPVHKEEILARLQERARLVSTLQSVKAEAEVNIYKVMPWAETLDVYLAFGQPAMFRMKIKHDLATLDLGANEEVWWLYAPHDEKITRQGRIDAPAKQEDELPINPEDIAHALGISPFAPATTLVENTWQGYVLTELGLDEQGGVKLLRRTTIDRMTYAVKGLETYSPDGTVKMRVTYEDIIDVGGKVEPVYMASRIRMKWADGYMNLRLGAMKIGYELHPRMFTPPEE